MRGAKREANKRLIALSAFALLSSATPPLPAPPPLTLTGGPAPQKKGADQDGGRGGGRRFGWVVPVLRGRKPLPEPPDDAPRPARRASAHRPAAGDHGPAARPGGWLPLGPGAELRHRRALHRRGGL